MQAQEKGSRKHFFIYPVNKCKHGSDRCKDIVTQLHTCNNLDTVNLNKQLGPRAASTFSAE